MCLRAGSYSDARYARTVPRVGVSTVPPLEDVPALGLVSREPVESVELSRSRVRNGRSATRASPARYPRHDSNVHTLGLGQLPLPFGLQGPDGWGPGC